METLRGYATHECETFDSVTKVRITPIQAQEVAENPFEMTYKSISVESIKNLPEKPIEVSELKSSDYYQDNDKKVFFGHYWLKGEPSLYETIFVT